MHEEQEYPSMTTKDSHAETAESKSQNRIRFSLISLVLVPVFLSPFFLSLTIVGDVLQRRPPRMGLAILLYAICYTVVFCLAWQRRSDNGFLSKMKSRLYPAIVRGFVVGLAFGGQLLFLPIIVAEPLGYIKRKGGPIALDFLGLLLLGFTVFTLTFAVLGASVGCIVGIFGKRFGNR